MDAALAEFGARGYHAASIDDVAARAGVTKGAVYYYFQDKDDLARDLAASLWERLKGVALAAFDPGANTLDNLNRCFDAYLQALDALPEARFFLRDAWTVPQSSTDVAERADAYGLMRDILAAGIARGEVAALDPEAMARVLVGAYNEATLHVLETGEPGPTVAVLRQLVASLAPAPVGADPRATQERAR
jgi:TetR/AcrR family acrAB operon transcriptional repressor